METPGKFPTAIAAFSSLPKWIFHDICLWSRETCHEDPKSDFEKVVGGLNPSEKYMSSSVGMTFPTEWKVIKFMFQTTNQKSSAVRFWEDWGGRAVPQRIIVLEHVFIFHSHKKRFLQLMEYLHHIETCISHLWHHLQNNHKTIPMLIRSKTSSLQSRCFRVTDPTHPAQHAPASLRRDSILQDNKFQTLKNKTENPKNQNPKPI
jgi:hypothetical protein